MQHGMQPWRELNLQNVMLDLTRILRLRKLYLLRAGNGETVGISKRYVYEAERDNALKLVKREAPDATTVG
ncbi:DUF1508 domain-containing protein [Dyadobacter psychrotolerans]|uniref:DUF1508 domain-containing protein n=1 Tax=Dyadobacter psychrotolerans TaxID=2541721 RepID=A0A4R5DHC1_9BACT|nr:DUF1508 domain-containing protein [Dyadobacter psychrotolerans]